MKFLVNTIKGLVKKYGWKFLIIGGVGKLISFTSVLVILGHWYGGLLSEEGAQAEIYLYPEYSLEQNLDAIEEAIDEAGGHGDRVRRVIWARGWNERLKPGKYILSGDLSIGEAASKLATGARESVKVVVPASRDLAVVAGRLSAPIAADSAEVLALISPDSIRWQIIPNTYEMWWETDAEGALARLQKESAKWWNEERVGLAAAQGLTPEEAVILASIVQAETAAPSEAPTVAGLYLNRLKKGMLLQADPTLIYAVGDPSIRRVLNEHIEIESPYNTYKYVGLPPGTIRTPEPTYIEAVLNAEDHKYIYMCAEPGGTGKHSFAVSFRDHKRNARRYQRWLNSERIYR